jgi:hypothetical protein
MTGEYKIKMNISLYLQTVDEIFIVVWWKCKVFKYQADKVHYFLHSPHIRISRVIAYLSSIKILILYIYTPSVPKYKQKLVNKSECIWSKFWTKYINFLWLTFAYILGRMEYIYITVKITFGVIICSMK